MKLAGIYKKSCKKSKIFSISFCKPRDIYFVIHNPISDSSCQIENGVFVWFDGLGGINDKHKRRIKDFVGVSALSKTLAARLWTVLTFAPNTPKIELVSINHCQI